MTGDIGQPFLDDPKQREFIFSRQPAEVRHDMEIDSNTAAFDVSVNVAAQRRSEPCFIEQRGMQHVGYRSHLANRLLEQVVKLTEKRLG